MTVVVWIIILCMVALNALFAAYEIALASITIGRLKILADEHRPGAKTALYMKQNMEGSLAVVQLGITLVGAIAAATGGVGVDEDLTPYLMAKLHVSESWAHAISLSLLVIPLSAVTIVIGELVPKVFALKHKEWVCLRLSPEMHLLSKLAGPAVWLLEAGSTTILEWSERKWRPKFDAHKADVAEMQELRAVASLARTSRLIGAREERIILGAARLSTRKIREIMIPLEEIITLDLDHTMAESLVIAHTDMHTRFPVCERAGDLQSISGYVNFKDIVSELRLAPDQPSLRGIIRALPDLRADASLSNGLETMIREHTHIAQVRDEDKKIVGMVTLEDIMEELVGDILDEFDRAPSHLAYSGSGWVCGGGVTLERLEQAAAVKFNREGLGAECRTVNDLIRLRLNRPVRGGDMIRTDGLRFLVRKIRRQHVMEAQVTRDDRGRTESGEMIPAMSKSS